MPQNKGYQGCDIEVPDIRTISDIPATPSSTVEKSTTSSTTSTTTTEAPVQCGANEWKCVNSGECIPVEFRLTGFLFKVTNKN